MIARIAATKAKVLLFALKGDGLNFIPQADDLGLLKGTTVAFLGLSETDLGVFGGKGQNMFVAVPFVATSDVPSVKAFVAKAKAETGADATISNYVMTHYNALIAMKAAIEQAGRVDKESMIDALEGLVIKSPAGTVTIGKNHHAAMKHVHGQDEGTRPHHCTRAGRDRTGAQMQILTEQSRRIAALMVFCVVFAAPLLGSAKELNYGCSTPPLEVMFAIVDGRYNGTVGCGNLFLQSDIPTPPVVRWKRANAGKLYTLMMLDLDGNANGSWPDPVPPGQNAPVRHWIVGNIPGDLLRGTGYVESGGASSINKIAVLQRYRAPHIPVVSDRYGLYLFQQKQEIGFAALPDPITSFESATFLERYHLGDPEASNFFVAIYTSESPFSGKAFHGNDVSRVWHQGYGKGKLAPAQ